VQYAAWSGAAAGASAGRGRRTGCSGSRPGTLQVLQVEQLQGDGGLPPLGVNPCAIGRGPLPLPVEPAFERLVGERLDLGPVQPRGLGPGE